MSEFGWTNGFELFFATPSLTSITLGHNSLGKSNNKLIPHHITLRNQRRDQDPLEFLGYSTT
jgi:hypothetical protein